MRSSYAGSRKKTEFHQAVANLSRKLKPLENAMFAMGEIEDESWEDPSRR